jgi:hypothetical protein
MEYKLQRGTVECILTRCGITVNVVSTLFSELTPVWYTQVPTFEGIRCPNIL